MPQPRPMPQARSLFEGHPAAPAELTPLAPRPVPHQASLFGPTDRWIHRWRVASRTTPAKRYTVAVDADGTWGCSCPHWIYHRARCHHIEAIAGPAGDAPAEA